MTRSAVYSHAVASVALCLVTLVAIIGGCTPSVPEVLRTSPVRNTEFVPITPAVIEIVFDQPMSTSSVESAFMITPAMDGPPPVFAWAQNNSLMTVTYTQGFEPETHYEVVISQDAAGSNGVRLASPLKIEFTTAPRAVR